MGLSLLPKLIALTHWNAGLFQALAVTLEHERSRQLTECSAIDESLDRAACDVVPACVESDSQLLTTHGIRRLADGTLIIIESGSIGPVRLLNFPTFFYLQGCRSADRSRSQNSRLQVHLKGAS